MSNCSYTRFVSFCSVCEIPIAGAWITFPPRLLQLGPHLGKTLQSMCIRRFVYQRKKSSLRKEQIWHTKTTTNASTSSLLQQWMNSKPLDAARTVQAIALNLLSGQPYVGIQGAMVRFASTLLWNRPCNVVGRAWKLGRLQEWLKCLLMIVGKRVLW